jgi:hypothetical protein
MTIDNVRCNDKPLGAFLTGRHGAANALDAYGKQRGLTSAYYFEGDRDAAFAVIDFVLAYVGNHGNVIPIASFEFDAVDHHGNVSQHVTMTDCVVTAWALHSPEQPEDAAAASRPDVEHVRIESKHVQVHAGADNKTYRKTDPNVAA